MNSCTVVVDCCIILHILRDYVKDDVAEFVKTNGSAEASLDLLQDRYRYEPWRDRR